jgi:hypothetical protein
LGLKKAKASRGLNKVLTLAASFLLPTILIGGITYGTIAGIFSNENSTVPFDDSIIPLSVADFQDVDVDKYIEQNRNQETLINWKQLTWNAQKANAHMNRTTKQQQQQNI